MQRLLPTTLSTICLALVISALGCASTSTDSGHKAIVTDQLEPYECGTVQRLHTYQGVFLASQPAAADFEQAKMGGVKSVINLRHHAENKDFDEQKVVTDLGLTYHNVPWNGPDQLTDAKFDEVRSLLASVERPILLHCSSGNRVGAMWLAHRVLDHDLSYDAALAEAKIVGLTSPDYEKKAADYIARMSK